MLLYVLGRNEIYVKATENDGQEFWRGWNCFIIGRVDGKYNTQEHAFFSNIYRMTLCRRFFITNRGYLGLGPRNMQIRYTLWRVGTVPWCSVKLLTNDRFALRIRLTHLWETATFTE
jgi:hypothetical protein